MKLSEILTEAPIGFGQKMWTGAKQKAFSKIPGMKDTAAELQGKQQFQQQVNAMYTNFRKFLGSMNKDINSASAGDLKKFLQNQGVQTPQQLERIADSQPIDKGSVAEYMKAARQAQAAGGDQQQGQQKQRRVMPTNRGRKQATGAAGGNVDLQSLQKQVNAIQQAIQKMQSAG